MNQRSRVLKALARFVLKLAYRYEVRGLEQLDGIAPGEHVLIVVNHVSLLDGPLMMAALNDQPGPTASAVDDLRRAMTDVHRNVF